MKVMSLLQPWASLWVAGPKRIETRSWGTSYRGRIAVAASKRFDSAERSLCFQPPFEGALSRLGFNLPGALQDVYVKLLDGLEVVRYDGPGFNGVPVLGLLDGEPVVAIMEWQPPATARQSPGTGGARG